MQSIQLSIIYVRPQARRPSCWQKQKAENIVLDIKLTFMPTHYYLVLELDCNLHELSSLEWLAIISQFSSGSVQSYKT